MSCSNSARVSQEVVVTAAAFDLLSPEVVFSAAEEYLGEVMDGTLQVYPSYVNRVYGLRSEEGNEYVAKFYRPGRWHDEAVADEHEFLDDCKAFDVPVVSPITSEDETTLGAVTAHDAETAIEYLFALFPKKGGRSFDADSDEDWIRLGSLAGRVHLAGARRPASYRLTCTPTESTGRFLEELRHDAVVHPDVAEEFFSRAQDALDWIGPLFEDVALQRIHGDFHRGNILDRENEGLLVVDFDDMMMGPAVQDLWLLLPERAHASRRELTLILEGYEQFLPFDHTTFRLIEPLRLMRMLYYLAWSARQRSDHSFKAAFPHWGGKAFWEKELEDMNTQIAVIRDVLEEAS